LKLLVLTPISWLYGLYNSFNNKKNKTMAKIRPLHDRLLVERIEEESKTAGGIIIPDTAKEKPMKGKVIAVGNGNRNDKGEIKPLDIKIGDVVLFAKWGGTEIKLDGTEYLIMKESDVLAIIEN
jgi:chaperonin GroES